MITVKCKICRAKKEITITEFNKNTTGNFYCSKACSNIGMSKNYSGKNNPFYHKTFTDEQLAKMTGERHWNFGNKKERPVFVCKNCGISFEAKRCSDINRIFCSPKCKQDYNRSTRKEIPCSYCGAIVVKIKAFDKQNAFCNKDCYHKWQKGNLSIHPTGEDSYWFGKRKEETPNWRGGLSLEPYSENFNSVLKNYVRSRDNFVCQLCGKKPDNYELHVHHVDYVKKNNDERNLISLCLPCHSKTNGNRDYWMNYFKTFMSLKYHEGAETIPEGSREQANGFPKRQASLRIVKRDDDIVRSLQQCKAV